MTSCGSICDPEVETKVLCMYESMAHVVAYPAADPMFMGSNPFGGFFLVFYSFFRPSEKNICITFRPVKIFYI